MVRVLLLALVAVLVVGCAPWRSPSRGAVVVDRTCHSDYACPRGEVCAKEAYRSRGTCLRAVDRYGLRVYEKRPESVEPGRPGCRDMGDCPVRFRCQRGVCVR